MFRWLLLAATLVVGGGWVSAAPVPGNIPGPREKAPPPCHGLLVVFVRDGIVYTVGDAVLESSTSMRLWEAPVHPPEAPKPEGIGHTYRSWVYHDYLHSLHWRIAHDHIWGECGFNEWASRSYHIPLEDLPLLDTQNSEKGPAELRKKYGNALMEKAGGFMTNFPEPAGKLSQRLTPPGLGRGPKPGDIEYDFLPTGPTTWDCFVLYQSQITCWRCSEKPEREDGPFKIWQAEGEQVSEPFDAGFHEPFFVYGKPEAPFFVTKSGKVFQCLRPEKKEPKVVKVWDDPKRQVSTILNDVDTNRTFVAGLDPAEGPGQWFYFELTDQPEKKPFDRESVGEIKAEEPLKSALVFARFLLKEGKIKDKAK